MCFCDLFSASLLRLLGVADVKLEGEAERGLVLTLCWIRLAQQAMDGQEGREGDAEHDGQAKKGDMAKSLNEFTELCVMIVRLHRAEDETGHG